LFIDALRNGEPPIVHGDGLQTPDFSCIDDAVAGTIAAAVAPGERCSGRAYNIALGETHDLLELPEILGRLLGLEPRPEHTGERPGDVRQTSADASAAHRDLAFGRPSLARRGCAAPSSGSGIPDLQRRSTLPPPCARVAGY
jgi:nucleoside-diphosphate-sugar epimerase